MEIRLKRKNKTINKYWSPRLLKRRMATNLKYNKNWEENNINILKK